MSALADELRTAREALGIVQVDRIGEWCAYHHAVNAISPRRRHDQLRELRRLEEWMAPKPVTAITAHDLQAYLLELVERGLHPHTIQKNVRSLVWPFLRAMWQDGHIDDARWLRIREVRTPRGAYDGLPRPYSPREIRQFWRELDERYPWTRDRRPDMRSPERGEYWVRRWARGSSRYGRVYPYAKRLQVEAIVALALYGGMRAGEILTADIDEIHYEREYVRVTSRKGAEGHERVRSVPMTAAMRTALGNWIEFRAQVLSPPHDRPWLSLWHTAPLKPLCVSGLKELLHFGRGWELHRLRHTFATERYKAGTPLEVLQKMMGHANLKQTQAYAEIDTDTVVKVARATERDFEKALRPGGTT